MDNQIEQLWNTCLAIIKQRIGESDFNTWFSPIVPHAHDDNSVLLEVPSVFFYQYIDENYATLIRQVLQYISGRNYLLKYRAVIDHNQPGKGEITLQTEHPASVNDLLDTRKAAKINNFNSNLNPRYTFENYVLGNNNKLAYSAGLNIAQNPGKSLTYNPLFIYGPSAIGKTHLANAIGLKVKETHPELNVLYVSANEFTMQYGEAAKNKITNKFLDLYQRIDVLIIDDIQELIGKPKTLGIFFHIFNHLHQLGRQLIMCSDREPYKLGDLDERMLSRFKWGLTAKIERPEYETRREILREKAELDGVDISSEVIDYIAKSINSNVRDLEGILMSMLAKSTILNQDLDLQLARQTIKEIMGDELKQAPVSVEKICDIVCQHYSIKIEALLSKSRKRDLTQPRQVAMYLARNHTSTSLQDIGLSIGNRDHSTVLYACQSIKDQMDVDKAFTARIHSLEEQIYQN